MSKKKALIVGISGQDGAYLADHLLKLDYEVHGTSRDAELNKFYGLEFLGIRHKVKLHSMSLIDFRSVMQILLNLRPDEVYNLAGQSSVGLSFDQPVDTLESIITGTLNILEVIRYHKLDIKLYNASSSECFGDTGKQSANEETPFKPSSPYAVAKATAYWLVSNYRQAYNIFACSGILFNHESPLRPTRFVTRKIINIANRISKGERIELILGNINISRDWGWAPDYVEAMHSMLQLQNPEDFVIATGKSVTLEEFVKIVFENYNLNYKGHLKSSQEFYRPLDILHSSADTNKAKKILGWEAKNDVESVIKLLIDFEKKNISGEI